MGIIILVHSLLWVMQDLSHQPYFQGLVSMALGICLRMAHTHTDEALQQASDMVFAPSGRKRQHNTCQECNTTQTD